jgi:hypothetical protein
VPEKRKAGWRMVVVTALSPLLLAFGTRGVHSQGLGWTPAKSGWLYVLDAGTGSSGPRVLWWTHFLGHQRHLEIGSNSFEAEIALSPDGNGCI